MKSKLNRYRIIFAAVACTLWGATTAGLMAQTPPVGTWDCLVSGGSQGIAYINFSASNSLTGYVLLSKVPKAAPAIDPRNGGVVPDRGGSSSPTNSATGSTNWFGILLVKGQWLSLGSGKLLGVLTESGFQLTSVTNETFTSVNTDSFITNLDGSVTFSNTVFTTTNTAIVNSTNYITNAFSFTAKTSAKKITIKTTGVLGDRILTGKPATEVTDLSGSYYAMGTSDGLPFVEFLTITPSLGYNAFDVAGTGAGYTFTGALVESSQKRVGLVVYDGGSTIPRFSATGPVNTKKFTADLKGSDGAGSLIRYKIYKQPSI